METHKKHLPKGFLSTRNEPTQNAIIMFFVYLTVLPKGWNIKRLNMKAVQAVRKHFGFSYGFDVMIIWGILHVCGVSKTSSGRHSAMSKAYIFAQQMIGSGVKLAA
jgi:hypothetical protein